MASGNNYNAVMQLLLGYPRETGQTSFAENAQRGAYHTGVRKCNIECKD